MRSVILAILLTAGCPRSPDRDAVESANQTEHKAPIVMMQNTDPRDPAAWTEAQAIAAAQGVGTVRKRSDALPFLFEAERGVRAVLLHKGSLVKLRGPAVAGAYLRDLGVAQGKGPQIDDALWTLWALDALPDVTPLSDEGYVNAPGNERLADLTARLEYDGSTGRVVLHYLKPDTSEPPGAPGRGAAAPGTGINIAMPKTRAMVRMTLEIPATGDASWKREDLNWADPG